MKELFKKILVVLPVLLLTLLYLKDHYREEYRHAGIERLLLFAATLLILYGWIVISVFIWKQRTAFSLLIQSSFLVYVFMVLTLTGYFILFREIAAHGWWHRVLLRVQTKERINLHPFLMFKQFRLASTQVIGNLVMLLPLAIYIPLLFPGLSGFFRVFIICLLTSVSIELMQLI